MMECVREVVYACVVVDYARESQRNVLMLMKREELRPTRVGEGCLYSILPQVARALEYMNWDSSPRGNSLSSGLLG